MGLVRSEKNEYFPTKRQIHLGAESPLIAQHHTNWRIRAIQQAELMQDSALQYSSVISVSKEDVEELRQHLLKTILDMKKRIKVSPEENICCFNLDFFELPRPV